MGADRAQAVACYDGCGPRRLGVISERFGTPVAMNLCSGVMSTIVMVLAFILTRGSAEKYFSAVLDLSISTTTVSYLLIFPALGILRYTMPDVPRPYRVPGARWVAVAFSVLTTAWAAAGDHRAAVARVRHLGSRLGAHRHRLRRPAAAVRAVAVHPAARARPDRGRVLHLGRARPASTWSRCECPSTTRRSAPPRLRPRQISTGERGRMRPRSDRRMRRSAGRCMHRPGQDPRARRRTPTGVDRAPGIVLRRCVRGRDHAARARHRCAWRELGLARPRARAQLAAVRGVRRLVSDDRDHLDQPSRDDQPAALLRSHDPDRQPAGADDRRRCCRSRPTSSPPTCGTPTAARSRRHCTRARFC